MTPDVGKLALIKSEKTQSDGTRLGVAIFVITTELVFLYFMGGAGIEYFLSSIAVSVAVLLQLWFGINRRAALPADIVAFLFSWLFLDLAPKIQFLAEPTRLVNSSPVNPGQVLVTNLYCALFIVSFTVAYAWSTRRSTDPEIVSTDHMQPPFSTAGLAFSVCACVLMVAIFGRTPYGDDQTITMAPAAMITKKFLLFMPAATLMIFVSQMSRLRQRWVLSKVCCLIILLVLVALTENPVIEKRNALGPVYLGLAFLIFGSTILRSMNRRLLLLVLSMVLGFPAITVLLSHNHKVFFSAVKLQSITDELKGHFFSVNYDAWSNIYTTVEMVHRRGLQWGQQLLGDFLFFVPSSVWHAKPLATGIAIGEYLITTHSGWFVNLSAPLVAEAYIDFGAVGVLVYAVMLALLIDWLNRTVSRSSKWLALPLGIYLSLFLMFALRGSLMVAFAYGTGALLAFFTSSLLLTSGSRRLGSRFFVDASRLGLRVPNPPSMQGARPLALRSEQ